jgi:cytochrome b subunit of formate dehydrogenase
MVPGAAHAKLECDDCHTGVKQPCQKNMRVAQCKLCHNDQATVLSKSSHAEKLKQQLEKENKTGAAALCATCHGAVVHNIKPVKDESSPVGRSHISATCLSCHAKNQDIDIHKYNESVHGAAMSNGKTKAAECADCHGSHAIDHSQRANSKVFHTTIPQTCGQCHEKERAEYEASVHWTAAKKGFREPPVCTDCHGEHTIRSSQDSSSPTATGNVSKTCAACHGSEKITGKFMLKSDRVESFSESFHGLSDQLGDKRVANCASCHGNHMILPSSDSRSTVYPANLGKTCGNCHKGSAMQFTGEKIHTTNARPSHWSVSLARTLYIWLIVLTIGGMLLHNFLDLRYKARFGMPYHRESAPSPRFSVNERIQHMLLALSFISLAVSGFALKFPNSVFAWPFQWFSVGAGMRHWSHRLAATVFIVLAVYHMLYLAFSARGRQQFKALFPRLQDALDVRNVLRKYVGGSAAPMTLARFNYVEKAEYWALVWGSGVMTVTGLVLLFVNLSLSVLPLWLVDLASTVHYLEALLATLAILVWHTYWVVFDPEVYPLNMTWLKGNPRSEKKTEPAIPEVKLEKAVEPKATEEKVPVAGNRT